MEEFRTRARLVDPAASGAFARGLTTLVPRSEIEQAIEFGEYPAPLVLDIARVGERDDEVTAHAQVTVDWDEAMLKELLQSTSEAEIRLSFDADELERALEEAEVDAHGIKERVAVLAVAAAAAGAAAGGAAAHPQIVADYSGTPATTAPAFVSDVASGGTGQAAPADAVARYTANVGSDATAATPSFTSDVAAGGAGEPATVSPTFTSDVASGGTGEPATVTPSFTSDVASGEPATVSPSFTSDVASGGTGTAPDALSRYVGNVGNDVTAAEPAAAPASGGSSISLPSPAEGAGIAAGIVLLITGAGFVAVRRRHEPGLPA